jgi:hypothetical protein
LVQTSRTAGWGEEGAVAMKRTGVPQKVSELAIFFLAVVFAFIGPERSGAQQKQPVGSAAPAPGAYDARRETMVQGTVVSFTTDSVTPPVGTHVLVQTGSGTLDVHLGSARVLVSAKMELNPGDTVRLVGENIGLPGGGSVFAARILQKGGQSVMLRNAKGVLVRPLPRDSQSILALRGVR